MKLYVAPYAPNPRRVRMFLAEKGVADIEIVTLDLPKGEHRAEDFRAKSPFAQVPALELDDGRCLTESRAICSYLEALYPEPNLMGDGAEDRAFVEMWDRRIELLLFVPFALWVRNLSPHLAQVERRQNAEIGAYFQDRALRVAHWLDSELVHKDWVAGERFTIADITAACAMDFAKMMNWRPDDATPNLQRWRAAFAQRSAGAIGP